MSLPNIFARGPATLLHQPLLENWGRREYAITVGQVENAEVRKPKYGNGSTETEVQK